MYYTQTLQRQRQVIEQWRKLAAQYAPDVFKPFGQASYLDLAEDPDAAPRRFFRGQGLRVGYNRLIEYMNDLRKIGVNHLFLNLKFSRRPAADVIEELGEEVLPQFPSNR